MNETSFSYHRSTDKNGENVRKVAYAKSKLDENDELLKKIKKQRTSPSLTNKLVSATKQNAYNGSQPGSSAFDSNSVPPANSNVKNVDKTTGTDKSLDLPTDTETEDRGWDLPEALEEQLIAELESSYAEDEEVPEDVYIDSEAKDYVEIFGENDKSFYALSGVELHNELAEQMKSGSQVFISGTSFEQKQGARESVTAYVG